MQDTSNLMGQIMRLPNGQKVRIESVEGNPPTAVVLRIEEPRAGTIAICLLSKLEPLDSEDGGTARGAFQSRVGDGSN